MEINDKIKMDSSSSFSCSLKRKRPPKLEIPKVLREICTETKIGGEESGCFNAPEVGVFFSKGKKTFMEDTHKIVSFPNMKKGFFGVYDGHGGSKAAEFVAEHLDSNIHKMLENCSGNEKKEEAVKAGYLKTDEEFLKQGITSGACCVTALIEENHIIVSNLGDCRAVLCRGGVAEALTKDHRAGSDEERRRIQDQGGYVDVHRGAWRVHGILAVSRSIGDAHLKNWVSAEPDTKSIHLTPDMEYLLLASDGLWEKVDNQEAVNIVIQSRSQRKRGHAIQKENSDAICCKSPLSRSRRVSIVKCKRTGYSPGAKNIVGSEIYREESFFCENDSPPSKILRVSETGQRISRLQSPRKENSDLQAVLIPDMDQTMSNIQSPQGKMSTKSSKILRVSETGQRISRLQSPRKENSDLQAVLIPDMDQTMSNIQSPQGKMSNKSPRVKLSFRSPNKENCQLKVQSSSAMAPETGQRISRLQSPRKENSDLQAVLIPDIDQTKSNIQSPQGKMSTKSPRVKVNFRSPNKENSQFKVQSSSVMAPEKLNIQSPTTEICDLKAKSPLGGLVDACKELANLAVSRGSLDDITVMVVDLNQFKN